MKREFTDNIKFVRVENAVPPIICADVMEFAEPKLTPAQVNYGTTRKLDRGFRNADNVKLSSTDLTEVTLFHRACLDFFPKSMLRFEKMEVIRYKEGGQFGVHHDGRHRDYTALFFLNDNYVGGHLCFQRYNLPTSAEAGSMLLWTNTHDAQHYSTRVMEGEKWIAILWFQLSSQ
jgi:predicted 2-oxoglutarate/Fe(II)-dependent dioxygenase YbiX